MREERKKERKKKRKERKKKKIGKWDKNVRKKEGIKEGK